MTVLTRPSGVRTRVIGRGQQLLFGVDITGRSLAELDATFGTAGKPVPVTRKFYSNLPVASDITTDRVWHISFQLDNNGGTIVKAAAPAGNGTNPASQYWGTPTDNKLVNGSFDAALIALVRGFPAGSTVKISPFHEPENTGKNNTPATFVAVLNYITALVRATTGIVADVKVGPTYVGDSWSDANYPTFWPSWWPSSPTPDFLGVDFDGPTGNTTLYPYVLHGQLRKNISAFLATRPGVTPCAPEHAHLVIDGDTDHSGRVTWLQDAAVQFKAAIPPFTHVVYWDDPGTVGQLTTPNEIAAWSTLCQGG